MASQSQLHGAPAALAPGDCPGQDTACSGTRSCLQNCVRGKCPAFFWTPVSKEPPPQSPKQAPTHTLISHSQGPPIRMCRAERHIGPWGPGVRRGREPRAQRAGAHPGARVPPQPCTLAAPGALRSCCLILLNTKSQPRVNWFYSSLLCLPLNEEMPPIKF